MKKKILILSLAYYPKHIGGAEVAIKEITDRLDPEEYEFHVVCNRYDRDLPKKEKIGNVIVHRIGLTTKNPSMVDLQKFPLKLNKYFFQFYAAYVAHRLHKKETFTAIWAMMAHSAGIPAGIFKTFHPNVKYILTLQEGDPPEYIEKLARPVWWLFVRGFRKADVVQTISTFLGGWACRMGFTGPLQVIPNGVDVRRFAEAGTQEEIAAIAKALGKKEGDTFLITTSRLVHKNATDDVIRALKDLPPQVHFVVLGTGPDEAMLRELVETAGVASRVHFLGHIAYDQLPLYLKACDIFIRPSRSEGMGNSFIEAMAAGIPVIATQEGGIADFLFDAKRNPGKKATGWAVGADNPEDIAAAVQDIMNHPDQVKNVVGHAYTMVEARYNWDDITRNMQTKVFNQVLDK